MSNIQRAQVFRAVNGLSRQAQRSLAHIDEQTEYAVAAVQAAAEVQAAKVDAVSFVAQHAMQDVAFLSQVEQQLGQLVPLSVSRLAAIGDLATLGIGQIVTDTVTRLRNY